MSVQEEADMKKLQNEFPNTHFSYGKEGLKELVRLKDYDIFINALVGFVGLEPTLIAIEEGHDIALANKETLVVGGELIERAKEKAGVKIIPIDSEHSAIFQCLQGSNRTDVKRLIITASGGAFRTKTREELVHVTKEEALAHPNWAMGEKITIDSATMMNKGFEVIEAHYLFSIPFEQIDVLMHQESMIHSMVEFQDHAILAQLGVPDMRVPIQYALTWPDRYPLELDAEFDLAKIGTFHFEKPDFTRFPLLKLAYEVGKTKGILPTVLNGANEVANLAFRKGEIPFLAIEEIIQSACKEIPNRPVTSLQDLQEADEEARNYARAYIQKEYQK